MQTHEPPLSAEPNLSSASPLLALRSVENRQVRQTWEQFMYGGEPSSTLLRPIILESWRRCREREQNARKFAPQILPVDLASSYEAKLVAAASPFMQFLYDALRPKVCAVAISDRNARTLALMGDARALRAAEHAGIIVGTSSLEVDGGTSSEALVVLHHIAVQVHWWEHYYEREHVWASSAAPIVDPFDQDLAGIISVHDLGEVVHPGLFDLVSSAGAMIGDRLFTQRAADQLILLSEFQKHCATLPQDLVLCLSPQGQVLFCSPADALLFGLPAATFLKDNFFQFPGTEVLRNHSYSIKVAPCQAEVFGPRKNSTWVSFLPVHRAGSQRLCGWVALVRRSRSLQGKPAAAQPWTTKFTFDDLAGSNESLASCVREAKGFALGDHTILLQGESGTGKEIFAHAIHNASSRHRGPFVIINCGALTDEILGAELSGYIGGAFTGAARNGQPGKLSLADGGTLFFDEAENMSAKMQMHLLRILEEGKVVPLGAAKPKNVDVRFILSSNTDLSAKVLSGEFRQDLYFRISVLRVSLPPLRQRLDDIPNLAGHILTKERTRATLTSEATALLQQYCWPGNIRELRNVLLQAAYRTDSGIITPAGLDSLLCVGACKFGSCPFGLNRSTPSSAAVCSASTEQDALLEALVLSGGHITRAASHLGVHRSTLLRKMLKYQINVTKNYSVVKHKR